MPLNPPTPGLRRVYYDSKSAAKPQIIVYGGDVLDVPEHVAEQLQSYSTAFKSEAPTLPVGPGPEPVKAPAKKAPRGR